MPLMFTEKEIRRAIREELRTLVTRYKLKKLNEQKADEKEDQNFDPEGTQLPKGLQKLLDPDISPQKFAQLDQMLDATGKPAQQALAVAVYALNYADNNEADAKKLLQKAVQAVPNLLKQADKSGQSTSSEE